MIIDMLLSFGVGWVEGSRTLTDRSHSAVLCHLSYDPHRRATRNERDETFRRCSHDQLRPELAGRVGFEPTHLLIENQAA
jgi:hypothetical protein